MHFDKPTPKRIDGPQRITHPVPSLFPAPSFSCLSPVKAPPCPPFIGPLKPPEPVEQSVPMDGILEDALRTSKYH